MLLGLEPVDALVSTCTHLDNKTPRPRWRAKNMPRLARGYGLQCLLIPNPHLALFKPLSTRQKPALKLQSHKICGKPKTKNCFGGRPPAKAGVSESVIPVYELISAANSALSVIALAKWILPNQVFYWIPAAVGTSRSYNNSRPSCYNNSFLPVKQPGDLAKVSQTPHSLETVASDYTNKADQPRIVRHSWDY